MMIRKTALFLIQSLCVYFILLFSSGCSDLNNKELALRVPIFPIPATHIVDENGLPLNFGRDLLRKIAELEGWQLEEKVIPYSEQYDYIEQGNIDIIPLGFNLKDEGVYYNKQSILKHWYSIYTNSTQNSITSATQLDSLSFGILKSSASIQFFQNYCKKHKITPQIIEYTSLVSLSKALQSNHVDGIILGNFFPFSSFFENNFQESSINFGSHGLYFQFRNGLPKKYSKVIDRYLDEWICNPNSAYYDLKEKHYNQSTQKLIARNINKDHKEWLKKSPIIHIYAKNYPPYTVIDEQNNASGLFVQYIETLFQSIGLRYQFHSIPLDHDIDHYYSNPNSLILPISSERTFDFIQKSTPFYEQEYVLAVNSKNYHTIGFKSIQTNELLVGLGAIRHKKLKVDFPQLHIHNYLVFDDIFEAISTKKFEVAYVPLDIGRYYLRENQSSQIKLLQTYRKYNPKLCFGVPNNNIKLLSLMNQMVSKTDDGIIKLELSKQNVLERQPVMNFYQKIQIGILSIVIVLSVILFFFLRQRKANFKLQKLHLRLLRTERLSQTGEIRVNYSTQKIEISKSIIEEIIPNVSKPISFETLLRFIPEDVYKKQSQYLSQFFNKDFTEREWCFQVKGKRICLSLSMDEIIYKESGHEIAYGALQNITEKREVERILELNEKRFKSLYEDSPVAIFYQDDLNDSFHLNRSACSMLKIENYERDTKVISELLCGFHIPWDTFEKINRGQNVTFLSSREKNKYSFFKLEVEEIKCSILFPSLSNNQHTCFIIIIDLSKEAKAVEEVQQQRKWMLRIAKDVKVDFWSTNLLEFYEGRGFNHVYNFNFGESKLPVKKILSWLGESDKRKSIEHITNALNGTCSSGSQIMDMDTENGFVSNVISWHTERYDPENGVILLHGARQDITNKRLKDREFLLAQEKGKTGYWHLNTSRRQFFLSEGIYKLMNELPLDLESQTSSLNTSSIKLLRLFLTELKCTNNQFEFDYVVKDKFGKRRVYCISAYPLKETVRSPKIWNGMVQDVTEQREIVEKLDEIKRQQQIILESIHNGVVFVKPNMKIAWFNEAAKQQLPENLALDASCNSILYGESKLNTTFQHKDIKKETVIYKTTLANNRRFIKTSVPCKDNNGNFSGWVLTFNEITQLEEQARHLENALHKAEESDRLKSAFLANLSHEIRSPLSNITGFSRLLASPKYNMNQKKEFVQLIEYNQNNLLSLIDDVLHLAKIESGSLKLEIDKVEIDPLCVALIKSLSIGLNPNVELEYIPFVHSIEIETDRIKLIQVITNLVSNAKKFTSKGGIWLYVDLIEEETMIEFKVSDTGVGIPEETQKVIFNRFEKGDSRENGTGLGLSICKALVDTLGGDISVESEPNKGATFSFRLPVKYCSNEKENEIVMFSDDE